MRFKARSPASEMACDAAGVGCNRPRASPIRAKRAKALLCNELFVAEDFPGRDQFAALTRAEEEAGLLSRADIGFKKSWRALLQERGLPVANHALFEDGGDPRELSQVSQVQGNHRPHAWILRGATKETVSLRIIGLSPFGRMNFKTQARTQSLSHRR